MGFDAKDTLIKQTYDVANYGQTIMIPLVQDTALTLQTITPSTSTFFQNNFSTGVFEINDINQIVSNVDEISISHEGDDTAFDRVYQWMPESYGVIYKTNIIGCFGLNVSAFTSGGVTLQGVRVVCTVRNPDGSLFKEIFDQTINATLAELVATGTNLFVMNMEFSKPIEIFAGMPLRFEIIINHINDLTNTFQIGLCPFFCYNSEATNKVFTTSVIKLHIHPSLKNSFPVIRSTSVTDQLDFSGVDKDSHTRGLTPA